MKNIGIITIIDNNNYGNRLQNFALQYYLKKLDIEATTILNAPYSNSKKRYFYRILMNRNFAGTYDKNDLRAKKFREFNKYIKFSNKKINPFFNRFDYDYFMVGSDQVWNPNFNRLSDVDLLAFAKPEQRVSISASFGVSNINQKYYKKIKHELNKFKAISVREEAGTEIIKNLTNREDIVTLIDPTMLLDSNEWSLYAKKAKKMENKKYILNYFLGTVSRERKLEIEKVASENNWNIINVLDTNDPYYQSGPSEFLYLEKNASLICTDSFHSAVFAILFNRPFITFDREDSNMNMNSRLDTLLETFKLQDRKYINMITENHLAPDYTDTSEILKKERMKVKSFITNALDLNKVSVDE